LPKKRYVKHEPKRQSPTGKSIEVQDPFKPKWKALWFWNKFSRFAINPQEDIMDKKKYRITTSCPQCGCGGTSHLSEKELKERYGDVPNIELECHECMMVMEAKVEKEGSKE
jgi:hypothetical protein